MLSDDSLDEKTVLEKLNCLLEQYWADTKNQNGFYFFTFNTAAKWDRVRVVGTCLGRRSWNSLLQVVNAFADSADYCPPIDIYKPFKGMECKGLEELAIKIDLASSTIGK